MAHSNEHQRIFKQYLLGELDEDQLRWLEARIFIDDGLFEELLIIEDELIDEYLSGMLSASQEVRFKNYYLATTKRYFKLCFAKVFRRYIARSYRNKKTN